MHACEHKLIYAIIGLYRVQDVTAVHDVPPERWGDNAHTRKSNRGESDIVVRAQPKRSGRLDRCIPIGSWRKGAYRVTPGLLKRWGGLTVIMLISFSTTPYRPSFVMRSDFTTGFRNRCPLCVMQTTNMAKERIYIVHLRRPSKHDPNERRDDPFWEFGSFGCTRCHSRNLMHVKNAEALEGSRLAFAQGGSLGFRLVLLTPPVKITKHADKLEAKWPKKWPFQYKKAANPGSQ